MVDRRGRKDLYDAWNRVIDKMGPVSYTHLLELHMEEHREDIAALLGEVFYVLSCHDISSWTMTTFYRRAVPPRLSLIHICSRPKAASEIRAEPPEISPVIHL